MGNAKLWTALPPHIAIGNIARTVVADVKRQRIRTWLIERSMSSRNGIFYKDAYFRAFDHRQQLYHLWNNQQLLKEQRWLLN